MKRLSKQKRQEVYNFLLYLVNEYIDLEKDYKYNYPRVTLVFGFHDTLLGIINKLYPDVLIEDKEAEVIYKELLPELYLFKPSILDDKYIFVNWYKNSADLLNFLLFCIEIIKDEEDII